MANIMNKSSKGKESKSPEWQDLKNQLQEICWEKGSIVSDLLIDSIISMVIHNPDYQCKKKSKMKENYFKKLLKCCENYLLNVTDPKCILVRMQIFYLHHFKEKDELILDHKNGVNSKTKCLLDQVLEAKVNTRNDLGKTYHNIILLTILNASLGNPAKAGVVEEAAAAMQSIFPMSELVPFMSLTVNEKHRQLVELEQITTGIRLYNRDSGRGGVDIDDLPTILERGLNASKKSCEDKLAAAANTTSNLMNLLKKCYNFQNNTLELNQLSGLSYDLVNDLKSLYALFKQFEIFLRKVMPNLTYCETQLESEKNKMKETLQKLHGMIQFCHAVPSMHVYPLFIELALTWYKLETTMVVLSNVANMVMQIYNFTLQVDLSSIQIATSIFSKEPIVCGLSFQQEEIFETSLKNCILVRPDEVQSFDTSQLAYSGFCPTMFVEGDGLLIDGVSNIGVLFFKSNFYAFSCARAAYLFDHNPKSYIEKALTLLLKKFEYVTLFGMEEDYKRVKKQYLSDVVEDKKKVVLKKDIEIQTELHPINSYRDHSHEWNVWHSKLKTLQLINLKKCRTTSVQTKSGFKKRQIGLQVTPTCVQKIQTFQSISTQTYFPFHLDNAFKSIKIE